MLKYIEVKSLIHELDARVKILALLLFSSLLLIRFNLIVLISLSIVILIIHTLSHIPPNQIIKDLKAMSIFILLPIPFNALTFRSSWISSGISSSITLFDLFLLAFTFIYTTKIKQITQALLFFRLPKKLTFALSTSFHFIPIIQNRFEKIRIAQIFRGHKLKGPLSPIPLIMPLLHFSFKKSKELALSLDSRGFDPDNIKIESQLKMRSADYLSLLFLVLLVLFSFSL